LAIPEQHSYSERSEVATTPRSQCPGLSVRGQECFSSFRMALQYRPF